MKFANGYDAHVMVVLADCTWLPRLDQIIDMLPNEDYALSYDGNQFTFELKSGLRVVNGNTPRFYSSSKEQAVLMGLVWELYGKRWAGEECAIINDIKRMMSVND